MYTIETDVPPPIRPVDLLKKMEINDSVLVPKKDMGLFYRAAIQYGRRNGKAFMSRTTSKGSRIWRIE